MDDDPRERLAGRLAALEAGDIGRLAAAWTPGFADDLDAAHLVLSEHERGDLSHVLGPVLDRIAPLAVVVTGLPPADEAANPDALREAQAALDVLEGAAIATHAADLIPAGRRARLLAPWQRALGERA